MAKVKLRLLNIFALRLKTGVLEYEADTIEQVLSQFFKEHRESLQDLYPNKDQPAFPEHLIVLLNGRIIQYPLIYKARLNTGDQITLSFPLSGG